jgi:hypothetical protein
MGLAYVRSGGYGACYTFSEFHCTISKSSFFASRSFCASSMSWRVTTTLVFAMMVVVLLFAGWARCGVAGEAIRTIVDGVFG